MVILELKIKSTQLLGEIIVTQLCHRDFKYWVCPKKTFVLKTEFTLIKESSLTWLYGVSRVVSLLNSAFQLLQQAYCFQQQVLGNKKTASELLFLPQQTTKDQLNLKQQETVRSNHGGQKLYILLPFHSKDTHKTGYPPYMIMIFV